MQLNYLLQTSDVLKYLYTVFKSVLWTLKNYWTFYIRTRVHLWCKQLENMGTIFLPLWPSELFDGLYFDYLPFSVAPFILPLKHSNRAFEAFHTAWEETSRKMKCSAVGTMILHIFISQTIDLCKKIKFLTTFFGEIMVWSFFLYKTPRDRNAWITKWSMWRSG